jgi:hypothetical protein
MGHGEFSGDKQSFSTLRFCKLTINETNQQFYYFAGQYTWEHLAIDSNNHGISP